MVILGGRGVQCGFWRSYEDCWDMEELTKKVINEGMSGEAGQRRGVGWGLGSRWLDSGMAVERSAPSKGRMQKEKAGVMSGERPWCRKENK